MPVDCIFRIDEDFSKLSFVRNVRRDPELGKQLYLVGCTEQYNKTSVSFLQALGDRDGNKIRCSKFFNRKLKSGEVIFMDKTPRCAVDERQKLLYLLITFGERGVYLKLFHLSYQKADKFGYRCIGVKDGPCVTVENGLYPHIPAKFQPVPRLHTLTIDQSTGQLVTNCAMKYVDGTNPANSSASVFPADLIYNKTQKKAVLTSVKAKQLIPTTFLIKEIVLHAPVFSRLNHLLFWHGFRAQKVTPTTDDDGCLALKSYIPGHAVNGHLNTLKIDPVALVKGLLPKNLFDSFYDAVPTSIPKHIQFGASLELLGHMHKYVLFLFDHNCVLGAKWPKDWYKQSQLPPIGVSKAIRIDKQKKYGEINEACLIQTDLCVKSQLGDAQMVRSIALGHKFKDYRHCAFCGKEENRKKRNKQGKRMAKFKVCRICKELNFHNFYSDPKLACHYCSDECQRKDWKEHKIIHEQKPVDRK